MTATRHAVTTAHHLSAGEHALPSVFGFQVACCVHSLASFDLALPLPLVPQAARRQSPLPVGVPLVRHGALGQSASQSGGRRSVAELLASGNPPPPPAAAPLSRVAPLLPHWAAQREGPP